jgi:hypothetical protein
MKLPKWSAWVVAGMFIFALAACDGGGSTSLGPDSLDAPTEDTTGTLLLSLTDAPKYGCYEHVYITVEEVWVHVSDDGNGEVSDDGNVEASWTVMPVQQTYDLKNLVNGVLSQLGIVTLPPGHYTQMRMIIGDTPYGEHEQANYVVFCDANAEICPLKIPSGYESGVKLVSPFDIVEGLTTELILDFDAEKSVHVAGSSGKCILKPTIKLIGTYAVLSGIVTDDSAETPTPLEGVRVTAQTFDDTGDEADWVTVQSSTSTGADGKYAMYLPPGDYCIVAYKPNQGLGEAFPAYGPDCWLFSAQVNDWVTHNFALPGSDAGNLIADIGPAGNEVTLSVRNDGCDIGTCDQIEIWGQTVATETDPYTRAIGLPVLPAGSYRVVAFTDSETQTANANPAAYTETTISPSFVFSPPSP